MKLNIVAQVILGLALGAWAQAGTGGWKHGKVEGVAWDNDPNIHEATNWEYDTRILVLFAEDGGDSAVTYPFYFSSSNFHTASMAENFYVTAKEAHAQDRPIWLNIDQSGWVRGVAMGNMPSSIAKAAGPAPRTGKSVRGLVFQAPGRTEIRDLLGRGLPAAGR